MDVVLIYSRHRKPYLIWGGLRLTPYFILLKFIEVTIFLIYTYSKPKWEVVMKKIIFMFTMFTCSLVINGCSTTSNVDTGGYFSTSSSISKASEIHSNNLVHFSITENTSSNVKGVVSSEASIMYKNEMLLNLN